jgi:hypothetical protein
VKKGKATITVTASSGKKLKLKVIVSSKKKMMKKMQVKKPKALAKKAKAWSIALGKTASLKAGVASKKSTNVAVTFKSSNTKVLKVDKAGKLWPVTKGKATITVKAKQKGGKTKTVKKTIYVA